MNVNLNRGTNKDWTDWVRLVKKVYKEQGTTLSQTQAFMISRESYPGKGWKNEETDETEMMKNISIKDEIPANPERRKRQPAPSQKPEVHSRAYDKQKPPPRTTQKRGSRSKRAEYSSDSESEEEVYVRKRVPKSSNSRVKGAEEKRVSRNKRRVYDDDSSDDEEYVPKMVHNEKRYREKRSTYRKREYPEEAYYSSDDDYHNSDSRDNHSRKSKKGR